MLFDPSCVVVGGFSNVNCRTPAQVNLYTTVGREQLEGSLEKMCLPYKHNTQMSPMLILLQNLLARLRTVPSS